MTKTYELSNGRMIMADVDDIHHTATISVYVLDDLVKEANKADAIEQIRGEISAILTNSYDEGVKEKALQIIDKYR